VNVNSKVIFVGTAITMVLALPSPSLAAAKAHPIRSFFTSLLIKNTVGKPKEASPDEVTMQNLFDSDARYAAVRQRLSAIDFQIVPGQMRILLVPVTHRILWIIPIFRGYKPNVFVFQPATNTDKTKVKAILVATRERHVLAT
jgi:hypothetical protein